MTRKILQETSRHKMIVRQYEVVTETWAYSVLILTSSRAYLLIFWGGCYDIIHEYGKQLSYSSYSCSKGAIWSTTARSLPTLFGLVYPLSCYRVYDI